MTRPAGTRLVTLNVPEDQLAEIDERAYLARKTRTQYMIDASLGWTGEGMEAAAAHYAPGVVREVPARDVETNFKTTKGGKR